MGEDAPKYRVGQKTTPDYTLIWVPWIQFYSNLILFSAIADGTLGGHLMVKKCGTDFFVRNLKSSVTGSAKFWVISSIFCKWHEAVSNQYKMSDNRESHSQTLIAQNNALIEPVCRDIKNLRKRSIRGDLKYGMWTVLRFTDSHEITRGGSPINTRRSTNN